MEENAGRQDQTLLLARMLFLFGANIMPTRRSLVEAAGLTAVAAMIPNGLTRAQTKETTMPHSGPDEMPRGLTLLAIRQDDGTETLGLKLPTGVLDVARANAILNRQAPVTLDELLRPGAASALNAQTMIAYMSRIFPLEPGDVIFTGTPSGVILGMPKEKQVWPKAGDRIESSIEKLGVLKFDLA